MSFQDVSNRTTAPPTVGRSRSASNPVQDLAGRIFQMNTKITAYKNNVEKLGTRKDTMDVRRVISRKGEELRLIAKEIGRDIKVPPEVGQREKVEREKLVKDFSASLQQLQRAQRLAAEKEAAHMPQEPALQEEMREVAHHSSLAARSERERGRIEAAVEEEALLANDRRMELIQLEDEAEHNDAIIQEREAGIRDIQMQIGDVHEIFQDLAVLVNEQGDMLDDIESNIVRTAERTREGTRELVKAETSQKGTRNRMCFLLFIFVAVLVVLTLVLVA